MELRQEIDGWNLAILAQSESLDSAELPIEPAVISKIKQSPKRFSLVTLRIL
jgi:hypothetical protein